MLKDLRSFLFHRRFTILPRLAGGGSLPPLLTSSRTVGPPFRMISIASAWVIFLVLIPLISMIWSPTCETITLDEDDFTDEGESHFVIRTFSRPSIAAGPFSAICRTKRGIFWNSRPPRILKPKPRVPLFNSTAWYCSSSTPSSCDSKQHLISSDQFWRRSKIKFLERNLIATRVLKGTELKLVQQVTLRNYSQIKTDFPSAVKDFFSILCKRWTHTGKEIPKIWEITHQVHKKNNFILKQLVKTNDFFLFLFWPYGYGKILGYDKMKYAENARCHSGAKLFLTNINFQLFQLNWLPLILFITSIGLNASNSAIGLPEVNRFPTTETSISRKIPISDSRGDRLSIAGIPQRSITQQRTKTKIELNVSIRTKVFL